MLPVKKGNYPAIQLAVLVLASCASTSSGPHETATSGKLSGAGGASLVPFLSKAAKGFMEANPRVNASIHEARSTVAIQKLVAGESDFAFASRPLRHEDIAEGEAKGRELHMVVVAAEAVAIVVHPSNPIENIQSGELRDIYFSGKITDWSELTGGKKSGPIRVYAVNPKTSGTGELFASVVSAGDKGTYRPSATLIDYSDQTVAKVAEDPEAISFTGMGNVKNSVKALTLNKIRPTEKTILDTSYVLNRKLFVVTDGRPKGASREFLKYLLSANGQGVARAEGFTPVVLE